jgi:cobalt-zinc-cadmium resistance protein CzcA
VPCHERHRDRGEQRGELSLHGTEIERPLAIVMNGGLVTSTLFTLLALPSFYVLAQRIHARISDRLRSRPEPPAAEPAEAG